jgi:hypothetical protein
MPLSLTDAQLDCIYDAARPLQPRDRSRFLEDVASELAGCPDPGEEPSPRSVASFSRATSARRSWRRVGNTAERDASLRRRRLVTTHRHLPRLLAEYTASG